MLIIFIEKKQAKLRLCRYYRGRIRIFDDLRKILITPYCINFPRNIHFINYKKKSRPYKSVQIFSEKYASTDTIFRSIYYKKNYFQIFYLPPPQKKMLFSGMINLHPLSLLVFPLYVHIGERLPKIIQILPLKCMY